MCCYSCSDDQKTAGITRILGITLAIAIGFVGQAAAFTPIGPVGPYLQATDSPFDGIAFGYFHLEDFEDGVLNTPGLDANGDVLVPGQFTDSVDADDGVLDGDGRNGHSWLAPNAPGTLLVTFDEKALPALPTHVGLVLTNALLPLDLTITAFDANGVSLGSVSHPGFNLPGGLIVSTAQFFGVIDPAGISQLEFSYVGSLTTMEFEHIQYGFLDEVPVESTNWGQIKALYQR